MGRLLQRFWDGMLGERDDKSLDAPSANRDATAKPNDRTDAPNTGQPGTRVVITLVVPASLAIVFYTIVGGSLSDLGVATMVAAGAFALGAAVGFLFGIPRTLAASGRTQSPIVTSADQGPDSGPRYAPNTNLEEISDWLTKILVGAGLVGLTRAVRALGRLADRISTSFGATGPRGSAWAFTLGLLVAFLVTGFLSGYLYTRLRLQASFKLADDLDELKKEVIREVDERTVTDADALGLVGRQLNPDDSDPPADELNRAVTAASDGARKQIFSLARQQRHKDRDPETPATKHRVELTIPVYRALIAADADDRYFRNHAELAFALLKQTTPDVAAAASSLDKAIEIRDRLGATGREHYNWVRATCRMRVPVGDDATNRQQIVADLLRAAARPSVAQQMRADAFARDWCERNGVSLDAILAQTPRPPAP